MTVTMAVALAVTGCSSSSPPRTAPTTVDRTTTPPPTTAAPTTTPPPAPGSPAELPLGGTKIFPAYRVVAYYGTAGNPRLGVLGESTPEGILSRLHASAQKFATRDRQVQAAFELIATVAQASPGPDGDYSRPIDLAQVRRYVDAAAKQKLLIVLDLQPGRGDFLSQAKALRPFLEQPHVGLALDPEWRMGPTEIPAQTIGHVSAAEINATSAYVADIVREHQLPEKLFLLHQFRASMIPDIANVKARPGLAMVQHIDGFGTRSEKDATFARLRRPQQFHIGYKLFFDEDVRMYAPADVLGFRPTVEYVSYQ